MSRLLQFALFFTILVTLFGGFQYYLFRTCQRWVRASFSADRHPFWKRAALITLIAGNLLFVLQFVARSVGWHTSPLGQVFIVLPSAFYFASVVTGFFLVLFNDLRRGLVFGFRHAIAVLKGISRSDSTSYAPSPSETVNEGRRTFLRVGGAGILAAAVGTPLLASLATARDYQIVRLPLFFENLPASLRGLTLAHVSDLHSGPFMSGRDMFEIFEIVNSLHPHVTFVTGDFVDSSDSEIEPLVKAIGNLKAEYGVLGCLGNHDHFATAERVHAALLGQNVRVLNNTHLSLPINGEHLAVVGIDDAGRGTRNFARLDLATRDLHPDKFKILLTHRPDFFTHAKAAGMDLTLAGHTHGGQVGGEVLGLSFYPVNLVFKYAMGHYVEEGKQLYVNVGVGMVGAPIRLVRPEITLLTLNSA
ncbi:MAG: metallophosphoesterase [Bacteroidota bacterium]